jgi:hypothetical protein
MLQYSILYGDCSAPLLYKYVPMRRNAVANCENERRVIIVTVLIVTYSMDVWMDSK